MRIYILLQHDGFEYSQVTGVFKTEALAKEARDLYTKGDEGLWLNFYVKEFNVEKTLASHFPSVYTKEEDIL